MGLISALIAAAVGAITVLALCAVPLPLGNAKCVLVVASISVALFVLPF